MKEELLISVVIPTYNRVSFLETTVSCFGTQIVASGLQNQIEIVVGDDASPDETSEYLKKASLVYPFLRAIKNPSNLGLSGNVENLVQVARGEYIWLFGEDDLITEKALSEVVRLLRETKPNVALFNTANIMSNDNRNVNYTLFPENRLGITKDIFVEDFKTGRKDLSGEKNWLYLTNLLSAMAFKRSLFLTYLPETKRLLKSDNVYIFQAPLLIGIAKEGKLLVAAKRLVLHRKNENHWSKSLKSQLKVNLYDSLEVAKVVRLYLPTEVRAYERTFASLTSGTLLNALRRKESLRKYSFDALTSYPARYPYNLRFLALTIAPSFLLRVCVRLLRACSISNR